MSAQTSIWRLLNKFDYVSNKAAFKFINFSDNGIVG